MMCGNQMKSLNCRTLSLRNRQFAKGGFLFKIRVGGGRGVFRERQLNSSIYSDSVFWAAAAPW